MTEISSDLRRPLRDLLFSVADDKLILGHANSDWTGLGPILEEDIAFSALAQDEIAHAQALYELIASWEDGNPDQLAFGRDATGFRCATIVERPDDFDWAMAIARQFYCDHFDALRLARLATSCDRPLAALAARLASEEGMHTEHSADWVRRLGRGTDESRRRIGAALVRLAPEAVMLFEPVADQAIVIAAGLYPGDDAVMEAAWRTTIMGIVQDAGLELELPELDPQMIGGRRGAHSPHLASLLDEMTEVFRLAPDAAW